MTTPKIRNGKFGSFSGYLCRKALYPLGLRARDARSSCKLFQRKGLRYILAKPLICLFRCLPMMVAIGSQNPPSRSKRGKGGVPPSFFVFTFLPLFRCLGLKDCAFRMWKNLGQNQLRRLSNRRAFTSGHSLSRMLKYTVSLTRPVCVIR
jgi:hypothetical protein